MFSDGHPNDRERRRAGVSGARGEPLLLHTGRRRLLVEAADGEVVDHLLHFLHVVLQAVVALPQGVVFEVEEAEAGIQLVDEGGDVQGPGVVSGGHAVDRQSRLRDRETGMSQQGSSSWPRPPGPRAATRLHTAPHNSSSDNCLILLTYLIT